MKVLIIDNIDSFVYNLYQYTGELGADVSVRRNGISPGEVERMRPDRIVISPGPGVPENAGSCVEIIRKFSADVPILGVCLGHQAIGVAFGSAVRRAGNIMHGKTSVIRHDGMGVYKGVENPFSATRYHSLAIDRKTLPSCLKITAESEDNEIMGVRHKEYRVEGVQFHPESILTNNGKKIIANFLEM